MRYLRMAGLAFSFIMISATGVYAQGTCPPGVASLVPDNGANTACNYSSSGDVGLGSTKADIPFTNICANSTTKFPGRITTEIQNYKGGAASMFRQQVGAVEQQTLENEMREFEKRHAKISVGNAGVVRVSALKTEVVPGGKIIYFDYETDCSEGEKRSKPTAYLVGFAHTDSASIKIDVDGSISGDAAKAAATQVLSKFKNANFN